MPRKTATKKTHTDDYATVKAFKRSAQQAAWETRHHILSRGFPELSWSRGESAYVFSDGQKYFALVLEVLGTKNLIADALHRLFPEKAYYAAIAQCNISAAINDLLSVGALPLAINMGWSVGSVSWFRDERRNQDLITGSKKTCDLARCTWGGGETAVLTDLIRPGKIALSGAAIGAIHPRHHAMYGGRIKHGDAIVILKSSGTHTNALTLLRHFAKELPKKFETPIPGTHASFGELALTPSHIYTDFVERSQRQNLSYHYGVHITGEGWAKLMRANEAFTYIIERTPEPQPLLQFVQEKTGWDDKKMYHRFNMGAGFAFFMPEYETEKAIATATQCGFQAFVAGFVEKGPKQVIIRPKNIVYGEHELGVRFPNPRRAVETPPGQKKISS